MADPVLGIALLVGAVTVIALLFGVASCVRGCAGGRGGDRGTEVNEQDERVAAGVSTDLTTRLGSALDRGEQLAEIAANAADYDERLVELALEEPDAIAFVAAYPSMDHEGSPYDAEVVLGQYVPLFCWDGRWGAVDFAGGPLALTGSGPVALSMAYMGLRGATDRSPAEMAKMVSDAGGTDDALGMLPAFLASGETDALGLSVEEHEPSGDALGTVMEAGTVVLVPLRDDTDFGTRAHWLLVATENADGTMNVYDPTSTLVSARPWAASTIASAADGMYAVRAATGDADVGEGEDQ